MKNSSENVSEWQENITGQNGGCEQVWCQGWAAWSEAFHLLDGFQKLRAQVVTIVSVIWNNRDSNRGETLQESVAITLYNRWLVCCYPGVHIEVR